MSRKANILTCDSYELQAIGEAVVTLRDGGAGGDRTLGLQTASLTLSQLSYCPNGENRLGDEVATR